MPGLEIVSFYDGKYLGMYIDSVTKSKGTGFIGVIEGVAEHNNVTMINFINQIYANDIQLNKEQLKKFTNLDPFESWVLNLHEFNYQTFETEWQLL